MSYPPPATGRGGHAAPPHQATLPSGGAALSAPPGVPGQPGRPGQPGGPAAPPSPPTPPARRTAFAEGMDRVRAAATTEPGRLRIIGAVLAVLVIAFGAVTAWQVTDRSAAADDVVHRSQPLSADAADIYRSLADADTTAAAGFLSGGQWPADVRTRYEKDIDRASQLLVKAAASTERSSTAREQIAKLNDKLPYYTGLIEQARANNRQGLPLGGAYLRYANTQMRTQLLPAARELYSAETGQLDKDYGAAKSWPWPAIVLGVVALAVLAWAQRRNYRRTNRVFNHGMLLASGATVVVLLWLVVGQAFARSGLIESDEHGAQSLQVLNEARINSLQARGDESLTLVARGAQTTKDGKDAYQVSYDNGMKELNGKGREGDGSELAQALRLADDSGGRDPVAKARTWVKRWEERHDDARKTDDDGDYDGAVDQTVGKKNTTGETFDKVDANLGKALEHEQQEFSRAANDGRDALAGMQAGAVVLAVLGAVGAALGIGRRLSEYR